MERSYQDNVQSNISEQVYKDRSKYHSATLQELQRLFKQGLDQHQLKDAEDLKEDIAFQKENAKRFSCNGSLKKLKATEDKLIELDQLWNLKLRIDSLLDISTSKICPSVSPKKKFEQGLLKYKINDIEHLYKKIQELKDNIFNTTPSDESIQSSKQELFRLEELAQLYQTINQINQMPQRSRQMKLDELNRQLKAGLDHFQLTNVKAIQKQFTQRQQLIKLLSQKKKTKQVQIQKQQLVQLQQLLHIWDQIQQLENQDAKLYAQQQLKLGLQKWNISEVTQLESQIEQVKEGIDLYKRRNKKKEVVQEEKKLEALVRLKQLRDQLFTKRIQTDQIGNLSKLKAEFNKNMQEKQIANIETLHKYIQQCIKNIEKYSTLKKQKFLDVEKETLAELEILLKLYRKIQQVEKHASQNEETLLKARLQQSLKNCNLETSDNIDEEISDAQCMIQRLKKKKGKDKQMSEQIGRLATLQEIRDLRNQICGLSKISKSQLNQIKSLKDELTSGLNQLKIEESQLQDELVNCRIMITTLKKRQKLKQASEQELSEKRLIYLIEIRDKISKLSEASNFEGGELNILENQWKKGCQQLQITDSEVLQEQIAASRSLIDMYDNKDKAKQAKEERISLKKYEDLLEIYTKIQCLRTPQNPALTGVMTQLQRLQLGLGIGLKKYTITDISQLNSEIQHLSDFIKVLEKRKKMQEVEKERIKLRELQMLAEIQKKICSMKEPVRQRPAYQQQETQLAKLFKKLVSDRGIMIDLSAIYQSIAKSRNLLESQQLIQAMNLQNSTHNQVMKFLKGAQLQAHLLIRIYLLTSEQIEPKQLIVDVERGSKVIFLYEHLINTYQKYNIKKFILTNPDNEKLMDAEDTLETRDQRINFKVARFITVFLNEEKYTVQYKLQEKSEDILIKVKKTNPNQVYELNINNVNGISQNPPTKLKNTFKELGLKFESLEVELVRLFTIVQGQNIYSTPRTKLKNIRSQHQIKSPFKFLTEQNQIIENEEIDIDQNLKLEKCYQYQVMYMKKKIDIWVPLQFRLGQVKALLKAKLHCQSQVCLSMEMKDNIIQSPLEDEIIWNDIPNVNDINYLKVQYFIKLVIMISRTQVETEVKIKSGQSLAQIKEQIEKIITIKPKAQRWYLDDVELLDDKSNFEGFKISGPNCRITIIEQPNMEYYGFDKEYPIERKRFKDFYIEDDELFIENLNKSKFPDRKYQQQFRMHAIGYIFSAIKKHSLIKASLQQIKGMVARSNKKEDLWRPETQDEICYFNQTYVFNNILRSSQVDLRIDIMRMAKDHMPIPLIIKDFQGKSYKWLFEENYWIWNKGFTIASFSMPSTKTLQGKSTFLNQIFSTDFPDRNQTHANYRGGALIQYNIYRNDEYYINLIDISNDVPESDCIRLAKSCNLMIIHTLQSDQHTNVWISSKAIKIPVIILYREQQNVFKAEKRKDFYDLIEANSKATDVNSYRMQKIETQKQRSHHQSILNDIIKGIHLFVYNNFMKLKKSQNLWNFSKYLSTSCSKPYTDLEKVLKDIEDTSLRMIQVGKHFIEYKAMQSKLKEGKDQQQNRDEMEQLRQKAISEGLSSPFCNLLKYISENRNLSDRIMVKLRSFLSLIRSQFFHVFNKLSNLNRDLENKEVSTARQIVQCLQQLDKLSEDMVTPKIKRIIKKYLQIENTFSKDNYNTFKQYLDEILNQYRNQIQPIAFSVENFWREVVYLNIFDPNHQFEVQGKKFSLEQNIVSLGKSEAIQSQTFEVIDGDLLQMPKDFLKKVFENVQDKKVMVVAIFGPQSSGKSTLLNFLLGCDFMSSEGRCTKGIYGTYFQISNRNISNCESILVLDTEGLFANYINPKCPNRTNFDNKLVLFLLEVCDVIILNTRGDIDNNTQSILELSFDSVLLEKDETSTYSNFYVVLNQNGGPIKTQQAQEIQRLVKTIIKVMPPMKNYISATSSKGMPQAFNTIPPTSLPPNVEKFALPKKVPSKQFYSTTKSLCFDIMNKLTARSNVISVGRNLAEIIDKMDRTWSTINKFPFLCKYQNRVLKIQEQKITEWKQKQKDQFNDKVEEYRKNIPNNLKSFDGWLKNVEKQLNSHIIQVLQRYSEQFKEGSDANVNTLIQALRVEIQPTLNRTIGNLKLDTQTKLFEIKIQNASSKGFDDINDYTRNIKKESFKNQIDEIEKQKRFGIIWQQVLSDMTQKINRNDISDGIFKSTKEIYEGLLFSSSLKTQLPNNSHPKNIHLQYYQFAKQSMSRVQSEYAKGSMLQNSNNPPIIYIKKTGVTDLCFEYLDMSQYFDKADIPMYLDVNFSSLALAINKQSIIAELQNNIKTKAEEGSFEKLLNQELAQFGIVIQPGKVKQKFHKQLTSRWYNFLSSRNVDIDIHHIKCKDINRYNNFLQRVRQKCLHTQYLPARGPSQGPYTFSFLEPQQLWKAAEKQLRQFAYPSSGHIFKKLINDSICRIAKEGNSMEKQKELKRMYEKKICSIINKDLQSINLVLLNSQKLFKDNYYSQLTFTVIHKQSLELKTEAEFKDKLRKFSKFWYMDRIITIYQKSSSVYNKSSIVAHFIEQIVIVKKEYQHQKVLQKYISKSYGDFLTQIQQGEFKNFIKSQVKTHLIYEHIITYVQSACKRLAMRQSIIDVCNYVNTELSRFELDLKQVSQKLSFAFKADIHNLAMHLLWKKRQEIEWIQKSRVVNDMESKKQEQRKKFMDLLSGDGDRENLATAVDFINKYLEFLKNLVLTQKSNFLSRKEKSFHTQYSRAKVQITLDKHLITDSTPQQVKQSLLNPKKFLNDFYQRFYESTINQIDREFKYAPIAEVADMCAIVSAFAARIGGPEDNFPANIFNEGQEANAPEVMGNLFLSVIQGQNLDHQSKVLALSLRNGVSYRIQKSFNESNNIDFIKKIKSMTFLITNLRLFADEVIKQLKSISLELESSNCSRVNLVFTPTEKNEFKQKINVVICEKMCPCCGRLCDIDMKQIDVHSIHKCNTGHQIRAIIGMRVESQEAGKKHFDASVQRCEDLEPNAVFQFNGKEYTWQEFIDQKKNDWDYKFDKATLLQRQDIFRDMWNIACDLICQHYQNKNELEMRPAKYDATTVKNQKSENQKTVLKDTMFIFALDESGSMSGKPWSQLLCSLKSILSDLGKHEKYNRISIITFASSALLVCEDTSPQTFDVNTIAFHSGGTLFDPPFQQAYKIMANHPNKDIHFILMTDGGASYPKVSVDKMIQLQKNYQTNGKSIKYTSVAIGNNSSVLQQIRQALNGQHKFVSNASQVKRAFKEVYKP